MPGEYALTGRRDVNVSKTVGHNTGMISNRLNNALTSTNRKFDMNEINDAKESLKLLNMKMGSNFGGMNNNFAPKLNANKYESSLPNKNTDNHGNTNNNFKKTFQPNFDEQENDSYQHNNGVKSHYNNNKVQNTQSTINKRTTNITYKQDNTFQNQKHNQVSYKKQEVIELDDDRPAFVAKNKDEEEEEYPEYDGEDRLECNSCGRKFKEDVLPKHAKVCKKVFVQKRKAFDTKKQRILDSEHATMLKRAEFEEKKNKNKVGAKMSSTGTGLGNGAKKPKWQKQSEELRAIAKANKTTTDFPQVGGNKFGNQKGGNGKMGNTNYNYKPSVITEDYTHCSMCNRRYNEQAYNKHMPTCERRAKESELKKRTSNILMPVLSKNSSSKIGYPTLGNNSKLNLNVKFGKK
jgi:hypothetical protein